MDSDGAELPLTLPDTQNADNLILTQSQEISATQRTPVVWGKMCSRKAPLRDLLLVKDVYTLGRAISCDIRLTSAEFNPKWLSVVSKIHFRIFREYVKEEMVVYIEDLSSNGTFVNEELVGKGKKIMLGTNDVISLAQSSFTVYAFMNNMALNGDELPREVRIKYVVSRKLGSGTFGEVKLVFTKDSRGKRLAMKTIAKKKEKSMPSSAVHQAAKDPDNIMNEVKILKALRHPYIIRMEDIVDTPSALYIFLELMEGGELYDRIRGHQGGLSEPCSKLIFYQVVLAVAYLHARGITHRDLKPENILMATNDDFTLVKVADFGLSKLVDNETMMRTFCGTPMYVAPEVLITGGRGTYTSQVDTWSLGVILYTCLCGHSPFTTTNPKMTLQEQIIRGIYKFPASLFADISPRATNLIKQMMTTDPKKRIGIQAVLLHSWLQDRNMRNLVNELTNRNIDENYEQTTSTSAHNNNNHVFGLPTTVAKRTRHN